MSTALAPLRLAKRQGHRRQLLELAVGALDDIPRLVLQGLSTHHHVGYVADIDRTSVAGRDQQQADIGNALQGLARHHGQAAVRLAQRTQQERSIGMLHLVHELAEGHAVERQALGIRLDADLVGPAAHDIGEAEVRNLDQLVLQLHGDVVEGVVVPAVAGGRRQIRPRRQGQGDDRHVVDAPSDDQRVGNPQRDPIHIGPDLLMHPENRRILVGSDIEAGRDDHMVVEGLGIDMLDAVDALDDILEGLGHELRGIDGLETRRLHMDVDHGHADLRLLLAREAAQRQKPHGQRGEQQQGRQRRIDEIAGQAARQAELHGCTSGASKTSPGRRPESTSIPPSTGSPGWTTVSPMPFTLA